MTSHKHISIAHSNKDHKQTILLLWSSFLTFWTSRVLEQNNRFQGVIAVVPWWTFFAWAGGHLILVVSRITTHWFYAALYAVITYKTQNKKWALNTCRFIFLKLPFFQLHDSKFSYTFKGSWPDLIHFLFFSIWTGIISIQSNSKVWASIMQRF